jgi:hypothetical protein
MKEHEELAMGRSIYVSIISSRLVQIEDDEADLLNFPRPVGSVAVMVEFGATKLLVVMSPEQAISEAQDWGRRLSPIDEARRRSFTGAKIKEALQNDSSQGEFLVDVAAAALWMTLTSGNDEFTESFVSKGNFLLVRRLSDTPEGLRHQAEVLMFD